MAAVSVDIRATEVAEVKALRDERAALCARIAAIDAAISAKVAAAYADGGDYAEVIVALGLNEARVNFIAKEPPS